MTRSLITILCMILLEVTTAVAKLPPWPFHTTTRTRMGGGVRVVQSWSCFSIHKYYYNVRCDLRYKHRFWKHKAREATFSTNGKRVSEWVLIGN